ncbi:MAG: 16S rRNA (cytosine(1402)-N(4))-methyltransferase RsmH [Coprobacillus sp.]|nr:16S rRNA (cytosine(1402)-N(4))-methyltransferase RsmH [Coprobacillus sp.]
MTGSHQSVLLNEVISLLDIKSDGIYVDLTLGRAGHSQEILKRLTTGHLIGIDQDQEAIDDSKEILKDYPNASIYRANFVDIDEVLKKAGVDKVDGILMDLGVSSPQFDNPERGFSYRADAKLDMRMDRTKSLDAYEVVNTYPYERLVKIFYEYGEERYAKEISRRIVKERQISPIETTFQLVDIVKRSKPQRELRKQGHPAKQVFQALRIEVNDELNVLEATLHKALAHLNSKGRLAVISFQSLEDRIVKNVFKEYSEVVGDRIEGPTEQKEINYHLITKKVVTPTEAEVESNPRSKSAKLRVIERN